MNSKKKHEVGIEPPTAMSAITWLKLNKNSPDFKYKLYNFFFIFSKNYDRIFVTLADFLQTIDF